MIVVDVKIKGMDEAKRKLGKLGKDMDNELNLILGAAGLIVESDAKMSIQTGPRTGRTYHRGSITHQASAPGEPPATDTGGLVSSIDHQVDKSNKRVSVGTNNPLGLWMEMGTARIQARPWLLPAVMRTRKQIASLFDRRLKSRIMKT